MGDVRLTAPRVRVIRDGVPEPLEVQCTNGDLVLWDRTRVKHRWPKFDEAPFLWLTFISWAAAKRTGALPDGLTYERWEAEVLNVEALDNDEDGEGSPTPPGQEPG